MYGIIHGGVKPTTFHLQSEDGPGLDLALDERICGNSP